jgi:hypothetical protein
MQKVFAKFLIGLSFLGIILLVNSCASAPPAPSYPSSPQPESTNTPQSSRDRDVYRYTYDMHDVVLSIPYTFSDSEAFSRAKNWVTQNWGRRTIIYEDSTFGSLYGYLSRLQNIVDFYYQIEVNKKTVLFQLVDIKAGTNELRTQKELNEFAESIIKESRDSFQRLFQ